jgi:hypothetical protein
MASNPPTVLDLVAQYRAALANADAVTMERIVNAYKAIYGRIIPLIRALADVIASGQYTPAQVRKIHAYISLQEALQRELSDFSAYLRTDLQPMALSAAQMGEMDAFKMLKFLVGEHEVIRVPFDQLPIEAVYKMLTFLDPAGALYQRLEQLAPFHAQAVTDAILEAIGMGINPKQTARLIMSAAENAFGGGLVDALRTARTASLYAYREATRANYAANSDVVTGWVWVAELDELTCEACMAEHGTEHAIEESLDGHYNCRCAPVPIVLGQNPVGDMQMGEDWFNDQDTATQKQMMGETKWQAWMDGKFEFSAMAQQVQNDTYGTMRTVTPLKDLVGE